MTDHVLQADDIVQEPNLHTVNKEQVRRAVECAMSHLARSTLPHTRPVHSFLSTSHSETRARALSCGMLSLDFDYQNTSKLKAVVWMHFFFTH